LGIPATREKKVNSVYQLQAILQSHYAEIVSKVRLPRRVRDAAGAIMHCRTAALGGHIERCPEGHFEKAWYNSCKNRSCPRCGHLGTARWLEKQKARLLACAHHHVIFTIPPQLHALWRYNRALMMDLLFHAVRDTLFVLLAENKYGGLVPGMLCSLHTWGRSLSFHPHLHCLITAGGLNAKGSWTTAKKAKLLPYAVVRELYRGKMIAEVRNALQSGKLVLPPGLPAFRLENTLNKLGRAEWNVKILDQYSHGEGVLTYLARYVRGGPIAESRIISSSATEVKFRYLDHRDGSNKEMQLPPVSFILRVLQHVPPPRKKMVRYFGLYAEHNQESLNTARAALGQGRVLTPEFLTWEAFWGKTEKEMPNLCLVCGRRLVPGPQLRRWSTYHPGLTNDKAA
jgi:hypothetical protein